MGNIDFKRLETLSESELIKEQRMWDADQWEAYYLKDGYMTVEEFGERLYQAALRINQEKYGHADK